MVFAIAHIPRRRRDGPDVVRARQAAGKEEHLTDFIAAASHLIDTGVTRPQNLVALEVPAAC